MLMVECGGWGFLLDRSSFVCVVIPVRQISLHKAESGWRRSRKAAGIWTSYTIDEHINMLSHK